MIAHNKCPFCKKYDTTIEIEGRDRFVFCPFCHARGPTDGDEQGAVEAWNGANPPLDGDITK